MKRWILASIVIGVLLTAWSLDYRSQDQGAGQPTPPQDQCHDIVVGNGVIFLIDRCAGDTWRYHNGYDREARDFINAPSWRAMTKQ